MTGLKEPVNYSKYDRTYNNAIDLVAQAIGYAKTTGKGLRMVVLEPQYYVLFKKGMEVLAKKEYPHETQFTLEGIPVVAGEVKRFERLRLVWHDDKMN